MFDCGRCDQKQFLKGIINVPFSQSLVPTGMAFYKTFQTFLLNILNKFSIFSRAGYWSGCYDTIRIAIHLIRYGIPIDNTYMFVF